MPSKHIGLSDVLPELENLAEVPTGWESPCPVCSVGVLQVRPGLGSLIWMQCSNKCKFVDIASAILAHKAKREMAAAGVPR